MGVGSWAGDQQASGPAKNGNRCADNEKGGTPFQFGDQRCPDGRHDQGCRRRSRKRRCRMRGRGGGRTISGPHLRRERRPSPRRHRCRGRKAACTCQTAWAKLAIIRPQPTRAVPPATNARGPSLSARVPVRGPMLKSVRMAREKAAETEARDAPNVSCRGVKNVPKE